MITPLNSLLALIIVYMPYQLHFPIVFDLKGLNFINVLFLLVLVFVGFRREKTLEPIPLKSHFYLLFALLVWAFLMAQIRDGTRVAEDATTLKTYIFYPLFYFLFYFAVRDLKTIRFLLLALCVVTLLISIQTFRQGVDYGLGDFSHTKRAAGPFGRDYRGSNAAAAYFVIFVPIFVGALMQYRMKLYQKLMAFGGALLGVLATFVTYSRQAYIILSVIFFLHAVRRSYVFAVLLAVFIASYELWAPESVVSRIQMTETTNEAGEQAVDESTASRFLLWEGGVQMLGDSPLGVGLAHFPVEIGRYVPQYSNFDPHNGYVLLTAEAGLFALPVLVFLFGGFFWLARSLSKYRHINEARFLGVAYSMAIVGVLASNLFGSRLFNGEIMGNFWILTALAARYRSLIHTSIGHVGAAAANSRGSPQSQK
jgi:hypothetical protein